MCARLRGLKNLEQLRQIHEAWERFKLNFDYNPNIAPTDTSPIIRTSEDGPILDIAQFGLVHSWAKDSKQAFKYINARSETVRNTRAYSEAYKQRRCIIPVLGFMEFKKETKQAYYVRLKSGQPMPLIGLYEINTQIEGRIDVLLKHNIKKGQIF